MHIPVLLNEVMEILKPQKGEFFIDATFGRGGHSEKILEAIGDNGKLLAIDWDPSTGASTELSRMSSGQVPSANSFDRAPSIKLRTSQDKSGRADLLERKNVVFVNANYAKVKDILKERNFPKADGLLLDLGFSSDQLEESGKGFSFHKNEPLIMSYSQTGLSADEVVNTYPQEALEEIIRNLGEERLAGRIARNISEARMKASIKTSFQLAEIIRRAVPRGYERGRIDPATRTFQALRIHVNGELENLKAILEDLELILKRGGRAAIISFHSLEDRMVKNYFRDLKKSGKAELLNKKIIIASREESLINPRSRSAKLRGIQII